MFLKLNIFKNGSCAEIIAIAEDHEEEFKTDSFSTRHAVIWHNHKVPSFQVRLPRENYDNDLFIIFQSEVPFKDFCEAFYHSEYNQPENYNYITHNCAHAADHALRLANINLQINKF